MASNVEIAEKLCGHCADLREYGGQQNTVYTSVVAGNFQTALNTLERQGGCTNCIRLIENARS